MSRRFDNQQPDIYGLGFIRFVITRCIQSQYFMLLGSTDEKLSAFYCLETFAYNFSSSDPNDVKTLRLDAPGYDESNEP